MPCFLKKTIECPEARAVPEPLVQHFPFCSAHIFSLEFPKPFTNHYLTLLRSLIAHLMDTCGAGAALFVTIHRCVCCCDYLFAKGRYPIPSASFTQKMELTSVNYCFFLAVFLYLLRYVCRK